MRPSTPLASAPSGRSSTMTRRWPRSGTRATACAPPNFSPPPKRRLPNSSLPAWASRAQQAQADLDAATTRPLFPAGLTEREMDVLRLVGRGYSDRQISDALFISPRTVNAHLRNMFAKATSTTGPNSRCGPLPRDFSILPRLTPERHEIGHPVGIGKPAEWASGGDSSINLGTFRDARCSRNRDT